MTLEDFLAHGLPLLDKEMEEKVKKAFSAGNVLRYVCAFIKLISSAKFLSVAVSAKGEVYTWGFIWLTFCSRQTAVITPTQVTSGLGACQVKEIAAAKHHTVAATIGGEVFTWGSNREGQLGYTSVDTQATPQRIGSLESKIVALVVGV